MRYSIIIERVYGLEDVVFRIGGDEFVLLTNSTEQPYTEGLKEKILAMNGVFISYD